MHRHFEAEANLVLLGQSSLESFRQLGSQPLQSWRLDRLSQHPGALYRVKLRCGGLPLMINAGGRHQVPRDQRTCRICWSDQLETPEHFVSRCPEYAQEREDCIRRLRAVLGPTTPMLGHALDTAAVGLFLGDGLMQRLPAEVARRVDSIICDFLMVAWRKRRVAWRQQVDGDDEWNIRL